MRRGFFLPTRRLFATSREKVPVPKRANSVSFDTVRNLEKQWGKQYKRGPRRISVIHGSKILVQLEAQFNAIEEEMAAKGITFDSSVLEKPLHQLETLDETLLYSLKRHVQLSAFAMPEKRRMVDYFTVVEEMLLNEVKGNVLYVRPFQQTSKKAEEAIMKIVHDILEDYSPCVIQPYRNELSCDVSGYRILAPLIVAAKPNVQRFHYECEKVQQNYKALLAEHGSLDKNLRQEYVKLLLNVGEEVQRGRPSPKREREPLTIESVTTEVATRIMRAFASMPDARVCIGVAPTPVLAKLACETEVARQVQLSDKQKRHHAVCVRSLLHHLQKGKDIKQFVSQFKLSQMPGIRPTFAALLKEVFGVETCEDYYHQRELLYYALPRASFECGYAAVYGRSHFPEEMIEGLARHPDDVITDATAAKATALTKSLEGSILSRHLTEAFHQTEKYLTDLAKNEIAFLTADERSFRLSFLTVVPFHKIFKSGATVDVMISYGRLVSDEDFVQLIDRLTWRLHSRLCAEGLECAGVHVDLRKGRFRSAFQRQVYFTAPGSGRKPIILKRSGPRSMEELYSTNNYDEMRDAVHALRGPLLKHRQKGGIDPDGIEHKIYLVCLRVTPVKRYLFPARLLQEMEELNKTFTEAREQFRHSPAFRFITGNLLSASGRRRGKVAKKGATQPSEPKLFSALKEVKVGPSSTTKKKKGGKKVTKRTVVL
ncbi:hypothetical protein ADEAN_000638200 [Angomonas deanei]|uniref:Uncharacterized protein n=1 Tax=Angomonas deanei TaxID=59799 RepID=A0A7G2CHJ1_9TRYP|nr:hypothetical protein ADEAN_000638200 [Angomonas deanei]